MTPKLDAFHNAAGELARNRLIAGWIEDDAERAAFYAELRGAGCPTLRFRSMQLADWQSADQRAGDVFLVSAYDDVARALKQGSVAPYSELDSGGQFMLGLDDRRTHDAQRLQAMHALAFTAQEIGDAAREAVRLALVLPLKNAEFDVARGVANQAAVHYVQLLFGMPLVEQVELDLALNATYERLSFQIVGRHIALDSGLKPRGSVRSRKLRADLKAVVRRIGSRGLSDTERRCGAPEKSAMTRLSALQRGDGDDLFVVAMGLMAGTIGNITAAVAIAIEHFFTTPAGNAGRLLDQARCAAQARDDKRLGQLISDALADKPPAPFLTRKVSNGLDLRWHDGRAEHRVPDGATLLLALGVESGRALRFGGSVDDDLFPHRCVGQHLAMPLIVETVREVLRLPGLDRIYDPATGAPRPLEKRWGAVCSRLDLQYQRDRRMNQRPLHVVLPIKPPYAENAAKLTLLTQAGAHIVEDALGPSRHVHFAWFNIVNGGTHLAMSTVYDGDFHAYVEYFALKVPLFDKQFDYLDVDLPRPIRDYPKEFVEVIRKYNQDPLGGYFFSAYPSVPTARIIDELESRL